MSRLLYKRTIPAPYGHQPDLGEIQRAANLLGLEVVRLEYDDSGDRTTDNWLPRWHVYLSPFAFEMVET